MIIPHQPHLSHEYHSNVSLSFYLSPFSASLCLSGSLSNYFLIFPVPWPTSWLSVFRSCVNSNTFLIFSRVIMPPDTDAGSPCLPCSIRHLLDFRGSMFASRLAAIVPSSFTCLLTYLVIYLLEPMSISPVYSGSV